MVGVMHCPYCHHSETKVIETRVSEDGYSIRRRRLCLHCNRRFTTLETTTLLVEKRSGSLEPFNRDKVISGVRKACQGRPVQESETMLHCPYSRSVTATLPGLRPHCAIR